jgi:Ca2+-binding RTX toxin-like protein
MRRTVRGLLVAALLVGSMWVTGEAAQGGPPSSPTDYTCRDTSAVPIVPDFEAGVSVDGTSVPASAKVFQPVTWTFAIDEPELAPPFSVNLHYLRVRIPRPANLTNVTAQAVAATGEVPNPPINAISVTTTANDIVVQLPASPSAANRIKAWADDDPGRVDPPGDGDQDERTGTGLSYPSNLLRGGDDVILPNIRITGTPTPAAGGTTVNWAAPTVESAVTITLPEEDPQDATIACTPDGETPPTIIGTNVSTQRQLCDGKPVTVQLGFNAPNQAANVIQGRSTNDSVNALGGNDRFCGLAGNDTFIGGAGIDRALGGAGNDTLRGDAGNDYLQGDAGNDNLQGGAGNDRLVGGLNRDTCNGGPNTDTQATCEVRSSIP